MDTPPLSYFLNGVSCAPEIKEYLESFQGEDGKVAQIGALMRLWRPESRDLRKYMKSVPPVEAARKWAKDMNEVDFRQILSLTMREVARLEKMPVSWERDGEMWALEYALKRDRIESQIAILMEANGESWSSEEPFSLLENLDLKVKQIDDTMQLHAGNGNLPPAGILYHVKWLHEVGLADPYAWWSFWARPE